ncbi:MAG: prepilin-type N-terminal cleavage/methylation domain-containing protein [Candidatus Pacebacteria bacterium]|nr:prepilin-type N-terminal cleavage/methylation domain-containing protein [Candidatus Paceibacterota bacterium]
MKIDFRLTKVIIKDRSSFTLVELVVVLGILAILATVTLLVVRPDQLFKQSRDTQRLSDLESINKALLLYRSVEGTSYGTANIVYVSLPDNSSTCASYALPALPAGWTYSCKTATNYRKVDGTGWIPVNFTSVSTTVGQMFAALPIDPINTLADGYYTYVTGASWEMTARAESEKFSSVNGGASMTDGGTSIASFEVGTTLTLTPTAVEEYKRDSSLIGYWTFDEGSGTTVYDVSGIGNNLTFASVPVWTDFSKQRGALDFDGSNDSVNKASPSVSLSTNKITMAAWVYIEGHGTSDGADNNIFSIQDSYDYYKLGWNYTGNYAFVQTDYTDNSATSLHSVSAVTDGTGNWYHIAATYNGSAVTIYINGAYDNSTAQTKTLRSVTNTMSVGSLINSTRFFNGIIDEMRLYNRALSAAEILALYNATK